MELQDSSNEIGDCEKELEVFEIILLRNKERESGNFGKEEDKSVEEQNMKNMLNFNNVRLSM